MCVQRKAFFAIIYAIFLKIISATLFIIKISNFKRVSRIIVSIILVLISANTEILLVARANLFRSPGEADDSPIILSPRDSLVYLSSVISQRSGSN